MKLSVIIPCYNERKTIGTIVQAVREFVLSAEGNHRRRRLLHRRELATF